MQKRTWKIGELALHTGITVRTLHYYHKTGLLVPSQFTEAGHRLYTQSDVAKLQQILSLKQMGLSLEKIPDFIGGHNFNQILIVQSQLESLTEQIKIKEKSLYDLEQLHTVLLHNKDIVDLYIFFYFFHLHTVLLNHQDIAVYQLFKLMELVQANENNCLTENQLKKMKEIKSGFTEDQKAEMQNQWDNFILNLKQNTENTTLVNDTFVKEPNLPRINAVASSIDGDPKKENLPNPFDSDSPNNPLSFGLISEMYKYLQIAVQKL